MNVISLPFNQSLGLASAAVDGSPAIVLSPKDQHLNHLGTIHATVLYGLAEAASGQCLMRRNRDLADSCTAVLRSSSMKYRGPGQREGLLVAQGQLDDAMAAAFQETLASRNRALLDITVSVRQDDDELLSGTCTWYVQRNDGS